MFAYLPNESNSSSGLGLTIKRVKLQHYNVFVNKLISVRLDSCIHNIMFSMHKCIEIYFYGLEI